MNRTDSFATAVGARFSLEKVVHLLDHSEPVGLATEGLSTLISQFGATSASLFYASRPPLSVRRGDCEKHSTRSQRREEDTTLHGRHSLKGRTKWNTFYIEQAGPRRVAPLTLHPRCDKHTREETAFLPHGLGRLA